MPRDDVARPRLRWDRDALIVGLIAKKLAAGRTDYLAFVEHTRSHLSLLEGVPAVQRPANRVLPYWYNADFTGLDAVALLSMLSWKRPARFVEVGSGITTRFARYACNQLGLSTQITVIDVTPTPAIGALAHRIVRTPLQACAPDLFDVLEAGDILFVNGSHRVFPGSDETIIFFEVLPRLRPGVIVHMHGIFLPYDYPLAWRRDRVNSQYLLAAALLCEKAFFDVILPVAYVCGDDDVVQHLRRLLELPNGKNIPFENVDPHGARHAGSSFWIKMK